LREALFAAGFDAVKYQNANPDLQSLSADEAVEHYISWGAREHRVFPINFDAKAARRIGNVELLAGLVRAHCETLPYDGGNVAKVCRDLLSLADLGCVPYVVIGDSHSARYRRHGVRGGRWMAPVHVFCHAGSAGGLGNPNSRSGYGALIRRLIAGLVEGDIEVPIIVQFGQVDTEFVSIFQRVRSGATSFSMHHARAFNLVTIGSFVGFMRDCFPKSLRHRVNVAALFPPALSDEKWAEGYVNGHILSLEALNIEDMTSRIAELEVPTIHQRTELHRYYNERLRRACEKEGFGFIDGFSPFIGEDGLLDLRWTPEGQGADHHIEHVPTEKPIESLIWSMLSPINRREASRNPSS
jgi:hypothetical protein